jgi:phosphatidylglycerophosphatase A
LGKISFIEKIIGSGFYTGFIPLASGSFASLIAAIIFFIPGFEKSYIILPVIIISFIIGIPIGNKFELKYGKDPAQCTIDEMMGMWISLFLIPKSVINIVIGFFIWRFFDIIKPYPARNLEKLKGGLGIMIDDFIAALYSLITLHILLFLLNRLSFLK